MKTSMTTKTISEKEYNDLKAYQAIVQQFVREIGNINDNMPIPANGGKMAALMLFIGRARFLINKEK